MVLFRNLLVLVFISIGASTQAQSCNQNFSINTSATVPVTFDTGAFGGMQCSALEQYRVDIYVENLLDISDSDLADLAAWQAARQSYISNVQRAEQRLAAANNSAEIQTAITIAIHYTGYGLTLAGCNPSAVLGLPAIACVGGFVLAQAGTIWSFSSMGGDKAHAQAALRDVRAMLETHDTLSSAQLDQSISQFQNEFENACNIVRKYCLN